MRIARLDGIRGIAILLVILHHHHVLTEIGWAGVDLFFVLSGYLITNILRSSAATPTYWSRFYIKRAVRILPPLLLLLLMAIVSSHHVSLFGLIGYLLFLGNVMELTPYKIIVLSPLWSLAVEEHFYLAWPTGVRKLSRAALMYILVAVIVAEPLLRAFFTLRTSSYEPIYMLTPFRLDGLAAGALLALLAEHPATKEALQRWSGRGILGVALIYSILSVSVHGFLRNSNTVLFNSLGYSILALGSFSIVAWALFLTDGGWARALSFRPLAYLGRLSYGVYLYHWVILTFLRTVLHIPFGPAGYSAMRLILPLELALTLSMAYLSFRFMETPALLWGDRVTRRLGARRSETLDATYELAETTT
jgi:peptidoglycan/LPS O-acetylase OafA/YrhL